MSAGVLRFQSADSLETEILGVEMNEMTKRKKLVVEESCLDKSYEETSVLYNSPLIQVTDISKNTYVVPSSKDFAGEEDPYYLEKCYSYFFHIDEKDLVTVAKFQF